jgi:hypothetical protein
MYRIQNFPENFDNSILDPDRIRLPYKCEEVCIADLKKKLLMYTVYDVTAFVMKVTNTITYSNLL